MSPRSLGEKQKDGQAGRRTITPSALITLIALAALVALPAPGPAAQAQEIGYQQVSAGRVHTCALLLDGSVDCWGGQNRGATPDFGQWKDPSGVFVQVSAGGFHTCGLRPDGHVECWGRNTVTVGICTKTTCFEKYAGQIDAPSDVLFSQVSAGEFHTCGLKLDGSVDCWGDNASGEAADQAGPFTAVSAGEQHTCALRSDGHVKCWGNNLNGRATDGIGPFTQFSAGGSHNCAVRQSDGVVECWGANGYGQSSPKPGAFTEISAGNLHSAGLKTDGTLKSWGYDFYGQVRNTPTGQFKHVDAGEGHTCAIMENNQLDCWGRNDWGQTKVPVLAGPGLSFGFDGFSPPVEAAPVLNEVKAGSAVPLKFSLHGDQGLEVIAPDYPASQALDCASFEPSGELAPVQPAGGSGLTYDTVSDQYTYVWKTAKAWAGTCRVLAFKLADETEHLVAFKFK